MKGFSVHKEATNLINGNNISRLWEIGGGNNVRPSNCMRCVFLNLETFYFTNTGVPDGSKEQGIRQGRKDYPGYASLAK